MAMLPQRSSESESASCVSSLRYKDGAVLRALWKISLYRDHPNATSRPIRWEVLEMGRVDKLFFRVPKVQDFFYERPAKAPKEKRPSREKKFRPYPF